MAIISDDPRWDLFLSNQMKCPCCGKSGATMLSFEYDRPDPFPKDAPKQENWMLTQETGDILTEDFCRLDKYRFVRVILQVPLIGCTEVLMLGVWGSLSAENFDRYLAGFDDGTQAHLGEMGSWLCNAVPPDVRKPVAMALHPQDNRQRPQLFCTDDTNDLYRFQRDGLSFDGLADFLRSYGHDIRSAPSLRQ